MQTQLAASFFHAKENDNLKQEVDKLLGSFDLGLSGIEIKKSKEHNKLFSVHGVHSVGGKEEYLPIHYESDGTRRLLVLLKSLLSVLKNGGVAVIDEFDASLHPDISSELFDLFIQPETNPKRAQLLFSTHNHQILNQLDKYQIVFVEKDDRGVSEVWRMDEMSGVRADDNYFSKYMAGAYGAIPKI